MRCIVGCIDPAEEVLHDARLQLRAAAATVHEEMSATGGWAAIDATRVLHDSSQQGRTHSTSWQHGMLHPHLHHSSIPDTAYTII